MTDQAQAVETSADDDLLAALDDQTPEQEPTEEQTAQAEPEQEETEQEQPEESAKVRVVVKNDSGEDEEREVSLDELAKGYMLQSDYTRKTQALSAERSQVYAQAQQAVAQYQQSAVDSVNQLQELVWAQLSPELQGVDWVRLSTEDPARFVQLQARQQQLNGTLQALEQQRTQLSAQREQQLEQLADHAITQSDEYLRSQIKGFDAVSAQKLVQDVEKHIGWKPADLKNAAKALVSAGMHPATLGQVLQLAHEAIQFRQLQAQKPAVQAKVAQAPKLLKPSAPQPKQPNKAALDRLKKSGRAEDLAHFL